MKQLFKFMEKWKLKSVFSSLVLTDGDRGWDRVGGIEDEGQREREIGKDRGWEREGGRDREVAARATLTCFFSCLFSYSLFFPRCDIPIFCLLVILNHCNYFFY